MSSDDTKPPSEFITDVVLAERLTLSRVTVQSWRKNGHGPPYFRVGRRVIYDWALVEEWVRKTRVGWREF